MRGVINRANAQRSTGPRTLEGKARSRGNALRHGLYAQVLSHGPLARAVAEVSPWLEEDPEAFPSLHERLLEQYRPEGVQEEKMVERLALLWTRLDRVSLQAQRRRLLDVTPHVERGPIPVEDDDQPVAAEPGVALMRCEALAAAEARLERSISRLQRDLAFLARYRRPAADGDPRHAVERLDGEAVRVRRSAENASEREANPGTPTDPATEIEPEAVATPAVPAEPENPATPAASADPNGTAPQDTGRSPYELERRRRLLWKPAPDPHSKTGDQPAA